MRSRQFWVNGKSPKQFAKVFRRSHQHFLCIKELISTQTVKDAQRITLHSHLDLQVLAHNSSLLIVCLTQFSLTPLTSFIILHAGLGIKSWKKLSAVRPLKLQNAIRHHVRDVKVVSVISDDVMKQLLSEQRRRWVSHKKNFHLAQEERKKIIREKKIEKQSVLEAARRKRKLLTHASNRKHAKLMCKGLPRSLVPTNVPEKHGHDPKILNETAVVLGVGCKRGYVKMMSTRADLKKFELHKSLLDINRDERLAFARKYSRWGNRICSCKQSENCKVHSAAVLWAHDDLDTGGILRRTPKTHKFVQQDVKQPRLSFVHFLKWNSITRRPVLVSECQSITCTKDVVSHCLSTRSTMLPAAIAPFCTHRGEKTVDKMERDAKHMANQLLKQAQEVITLVKHHACQLVITQLYYILCNIRKHESLLIINQNS